MIGRRTEGDRGRSLDGKENKCKILSKTLLLGLQEPKFWMDGWWEGELEEREEK